MSNTWIHHTLAFWLLGESEQHRIIEKQKGKEKDGINNKKVKQKEPTLLLNSHRRILMFNGKNLTQTSISYREKSRTRNMRTNCQI